MNAKKKFRLQKVLEVRALIEKNRQKEFAEAKQNLQIEHEELDQLENKKDGFTQSMNTVKKAEVSQFRSNQTYLETLNQAVSDKRETIAILDEDVETKRRQLLEAAKNRKALEKLKERKEVEVIQEENRFEQDFINEIATQRNRKKS